MKRRIVYAMLALTMATAGIVHLLMNSEGTSPSEAVWDIFLGVTQPVVAVTASYFDLPGVSRWLLVEDAAKYVSCQYELLGYTVAITRARCSTEERVRRDMIRNSIIASSGRCLCPETLDEHGRRCAYRSAYSRFAAEMRQYRGVAKEFPTCRSTDGSPWVERKEVQSRR